VRTESGDPAWHVLQKEGVGAHHPFGSRPKWRNNAITLNNIAEVLSAIALVSTVDLGFMGVMLYCTQAEVVITRTRLPASLQPRGSEVARRTIGLRSRNTQLRSNSGTSLKHVAR
jgi:hypothetical protein